MNLIEKVSSLLSAANTKTGEEDATLTDAVQTLCDGYGHGGGLPSGIDAIYYGTYTPSSDIDRIDIVHNLGTADPLVAALWAQNDLSENIAGSMAACKLKSNIEQRVSGSGASAVSTTAYYATGTRNTSYGTNGMVTFAGTNSTVYVSNAVNENTYEFKYGISTGKFKAGVEYTVLIIKG